VTFLSARGRAAAQGFHKAADRETIIGGRDVAMRHDRTFQPGGGNSAIDDDEHLDFGPRGWLTIGLKGLCGGRGFDDANPFCDSDRPWQVY
jgi:hypothetical protein